MFRKKDKEIYKIMEKQTRYSKQREQILTYLRSVDTHPDADTVFAELKKTDSSVAIATVYRNLAFLSQRGDIVKIDAGGTKALFDANIKPHQHFVCEKCGKVVDIFTGEVDFLLENQGRVNRSLIIHYGVCKDCEDDLQ